jgi:F-type H+-transporting ATPase subunit alpha
LRAIGDILAAGHAGDVAILLGSIADAFADLAAFASDLDETSKAQLERGARLVELLKQSQYSPMAVEDQVVAIFLGTKGHLDSVPVADVGRFEAEFIEHIKASSPDILTGIRDTTKLGEDAEVRLVGAIADFKQGFATTDGSSVVPNAHVAAMDEGDVEKESVQVRKPAPKKK